MSSETFFLFLLGDIGPFLLNESDLPTVFCFRGFPDCSPLFGESCFGLSKRPNEELLCGRTVLLSVFGRVGV